MKFVGRENELRSLNELYQQKEFQLFVLYGRRRVGKTTLLNEFCKDKKTIFYSAEQSNTKLNLEKFSERVFQYYKETTLEPFSSWSNALTYIDRRQKEERLVLILDEFPYLVRKDMAVLSELQNLIDHQLKEGSLFVVLCGSYMGFMEKEVLGAKSPLFGRRTGQLHMKSFDYLTSSYFMGSFSAEEQLMFYGAFGGTPMYLSMIRNGESLEETIKNTFLKVTAYLYEEPLLLLRQEVNEPGIYSAVIEAIAGGATKCNEIAVKIGEESAKCLKYINTLCLLGILYKETPFGEKETSRKTIYGISDFMFRFWYRYVFPNRTLIETDASEVVWRRRIKPEYDHYMGIVFEKVCKDYLLRQNALGKLPVLFTSIGRWWGNSASERTQIEIDLIAKDGNDYLICECKWRNEKLDLTILRKLREKADEFSKIRGNTWFVLFSKSGFTEAVIQEAKQTGDVILVDLEMIMCEKRVLDFFGKNIL